MNEIIKKQANSLRIQIEAQISGLREHVRNITERQHRIETNTRRAHGHCEEAIRLATKLRRLYYER